MNEHTDLDPLLVAYVDGELDDNAALDIERAIAADPKLREDVEIFRTTAMLLRAACGERHYREAPATPRRPQRGRTRAVRITALAVAASVTLALAGFGAGLAWDNSGADALLDEVAEYHGVFSHETTHLAEVPAAKPDVFAQWMSERLGVPVSAPDLRAAGLTYAGGRMLVIDGAPVADFLYVRPDGPPVAFCVARNDADAAPLAVTTKESLEVAHWSRGGNTYLVVGALDPVQARQIAHLAARQI